MKNRYSPDKLILELTHFDTLATRIRLALQHQCVQQVFSSPIRIPRSHVLSEDRKRAGQRTVNCRDPWIQPLHGLQEFNHHIGRSSVAIVSGMLVEAVTDYR